MKLSFIYVFIITDCPPLSRSRPAGKHLPLRQSLRLKFRHIAEKSALRRSGKPPRSPGGQGSLKPQNRCGGGFPVKESKRRMFRNIKPGFKLLALCPGIC